MCGTHRSCLLTILIFTVSGLSGCCPGVFGPDPQIECPASLRVGAEVTLTVRAVDDVGIWWQQQSENGAQGAFVVDGDERDEFVGGEPDTQIRQAVFRARREGKITIIAEEVMMGPPICFPPHPKASTASCSMTITDE